MVSQKITLLFLLLTAYLGHAEDLRKQIYSHFPASQWEDAMVSGNGKSGVMVFGGHPKETIVFNNHQYIIPAKGRDPIPNMADMFEPMREKMLAGDIGGGWKLYWDEWEKRAGGGMFWTQKFHPGFQMNFNFNTGSYPVKYHRSTQFDTGVVSTEFTDGFGDWKRETFASRAGDIIVTRMKQSSKGRKVTFDLTLTECPNHPNNITSEALSEKGWITWRSKYPERNGEQGGYEGLTRVITKGGSQRTSKSGRLSVRNADEVLLITALDRYRADFNEWDKNGLKKKLKAITPDFDALLEAHVKINKPIFDRVSYTLNATEEERTRSTEELIAMENADTSGITPALLERLFYNSRYLFMASSGEEYAPRLSGLFIGKWGAAWAGDYTLDANANMAVFGGHIGNMQEMMRGYQAIIERTLPQWRAGAKQLFGMRGILGPVRIDGEVAVPHHFNAYHAHCTATGLGPWIIYPLWEQYEITGDTEFLKNTLYPIMKEQLNFYEDFLTKKDENGKVIFVPSCSPENAWAKIKPRTSASINSTMDISAARHLFKNIIQAEKDLGLTPSPKAAELLSLLPPYLINKDGALQEWSWPGHGENYGHRHSSHVYTLWPGYDINYENPDTKHFVPAMERSLEKKNHSIVQAHDFIQRAIGWLRLKRGDEFYKILKYTLENNYLYSSLATSHNINHHIYNYDYILSMQGLLIETALFTRPHEIELLPAMPDEIKTGEFTNLKGRNRCTIHSIKWDLTAKTVECSFTSDIDQTITIINRRGMKTIEPNAPLATSPHGNYAREVTATAGKRVDMTVSW